MEGQSKEIVVVEGQLKKVVHQEGNGEKPTKGQEIQALYKGTLQDGTPFDSCEDRESPFSFVLGQGQVIKGWDEGFASMTKGERATLICSPDFAYGAKGSPPKIPPNSTLNFEVELLGFKDKKKEKWEFSDEQKLSEAKRLKQSGNDKLKEGNYSEAVSDYKEGMQFLEYEHAAETKQLLNILRLNASQAYIKLGKYSDVVENCEKVLKEEEDCAKALYRRAVAYTKMQEFDKAKNDIKTLLKFDPNNADAKKELFNIATAIREQTQKQKKVFGNIFSKGGLYDDRKTEIKPEVKKVESEGEQGEEIQEEEPVQVTPETPATEEKVESPAVEEKAEGQ